MRFLVLAGWCAAFTSLSSDALADIPSADLMKRVFQELDANEDGVVSVAEFEAGAPPPPMPPPHMPPPFGRSHRQRDLFVPPSNVGSPVFPPFLGSDRLMPFGDVGHDVARPFPFAFSPPPLGPLPEPDGVFDQLDKDGDERLNRKEFKLGAKRFHGQAPGIPTAFHGPRYRPEFEERLLKDRMQSSSPNWEARLRALEEQVRRINAERW